MKILTQTVSPLVILTPCLVGDKSVSKQYILIVKPQPNAEDTIVPLINRRRPSVALTKNDIPLASKVAIIKAPKPLHIPVRDQIRTPELSCLGSIKRRRRPPTPSSKKFQSTHQSSRLPKVLTIKKPNPPSVGNVMFQFFPADENYGAIAKSFAQCATLGAFFKEASTAWGALGEPDQQPRMIAVKAVVEGQPRPILVLWRSKEGFIRMIDVILKEAVGKEVLNVEIRCVRKA